MMNKKIKKILDRWNKELEKEEIIIIKKYHKILLLIFLISISSFLISTLFISEIESNILDEYDRICEYSKFEECKDLEKIKDNCYNAKIWYNQKNCSKSIDNNIYIQDILSWS